MGGCVWPVSWLTSLALRMILSPIFKPISLRWETTRRRWKTAGVAPCTQWSLNEPFRLLDCAETERQLAHTLQISVPEQNHPMTSYSLEEFPKFVRLPASRDALRGLTRELLTLSGRANPLYVPVIFEYEKIVALLARRKTRRIAQRLAVARATREQINRTMQGIDDYMNWFEATQARTASGAFRDYLKAAKLALEPTPRRHDPISVYLDVLEAQSGN